jgi:hypothetical protein
MKTIITLCWILLLWCCQAQAAMIDGTYFTSQGKEIRVSWGGHLENPSALSFHYSCQHNCSSAAETEQVFSDFIDASARGAFYTYSLYPPCDPNNPSGCNMPLQQLPEVADTAVNHRAELTQPTSSHLFAVPLLYTNPAVLEILRQATLEAMAENAVDKSVAALEKTVTRAKTQLPGYATPFHVIAIYGADGTVVGLNLCVVNGVECQVTPEMNDKVSVEITDNAYVIRVTEDTEQISHIYSAIIQMTHNSGGICTRQSSVSDGKSDVTITCHMMRQ